VFQNNYFNKKNWTNHNEILPKEKKTMKNSGKFEALENLKRKKQNRRWRERGENEEREEQEGCT